MGLYPWLVFLHIAGAFLFVLAHGVSAVVAFRLRAERDPVRMTALLELSSMSLGVMYVGLLTLLVAGIVAAINRNWFSQGWPWAAIVVLVVVVVAMYALASRYYAGIREALGLPSMNNKEPGPAKPADEIVRMLDSRRPEQIAGVGFVGLLIILWLMILKPF
jgi:glucan phosphoethanolaminetransferase (alkaline phosphatase superfamily)